MTLWQVYLWPYDKCNHDKCTYDICINDLGYVIGVSMISTKCLWDNAKFWVPKNTTPNSPFYMWIQISFPIFGAANNKKNNKTYTYLFMNFKIVIEEKCSNTQVEQ